MANEKSGEPLGEPNSSNDEATFAQSKNAISSDKELVSNGVGINENVNEKANGVAAEAHGSLEPQTQEPIIRSSLLR